MPESFPRYVGMDYTDGEGETPIDYPMLDDKVAKAADVVERGLERYRNPVVLWTGGKDSTLVLYFVVRVARERGYDLPPAVFVDHVKHCPGVLDFVERWADQWNVDLRYAANEDVWRAAESLGDEVAVKDLDPSDRRAVQETLECDADAVPLLLDTAAGRHLLVTAALNDAIEEHDLDGVFSGLRWTEQAASGDETFFSPRHDEAGHPPHDRIYPLLPFDERAVWEVTWHYLVPDTVEAFPNRGHVPRTADDFPNGIAREDVPVSPRYVEGYRTLWRTDDAGTRGDRPAWMQDIESTTDRAGRPGGRKI